MDIPVSLPFTSGNTNPTALAAPVVEGIRFNAAVRPPFQSFLLGPSTVFCVAVYECTVVIKPSSIPNPSFNSTYTKVARQLVVHDAFDTTSSFFGSYLCSFTPMTIVGQSPFAGALMITFFAPAAR